MCVVVEEFLVGKVASCKGKDAFCLHGCDALNLFLDLWVSVEENRPHMLARTLWILFFLLSSSAWSGETIFWQQSTIRYRVDPQYTLFGEIQPRWLGRLGHEQLLIARVAVLRELSPGVKVGLGYGKVPAFLPRRTDEDRLYQQFDWAPASEFWQYSTRVRMEERWIERVKGTMYRARVKTDLNWMPSMLGVYVWQELFLNFNKRSGQTVRGFDQYRVSFGPRYESKPWTIDAGYIGQRIRTASRRSHWNNGVSLSVGLGF